MKSFIAILALAAVATAADVRSADQAADIIVQDADVLPDQYSYIYETSNGIRGQERGAIQNVGKENEGIEVEGTNSYTSPEGQVVSLRYTAGVQGYIPEGDHIPVGPPIPEPILRALAYIAANPPKPEPGQRL